VRVYCSWFIIDYYLGRGQGVGLDVESLGFRVERLSRNASPSNPHVFRERDGELFLSLFLSLSLDRAAPLGPGEVGGEREPSRSRPLTLSISIYLSLSSAFSLSLSLSLSLSISLARALSLSLSL